MRNSLIPWKSKNASSTLPRPTALVPAAQGEPAFPALAIKRQWSDIENSAPRFPCCVVADASGSMFGLPIRALNAGLCQLKECLLEVPLAARSAEIAVIRVGDPLKVVVDYTPAEVFLPPLLEASGWTPLAEAIIAAIRLTEQRLRRYDDHDFECHRPWILVISDGEPNPSEFIPVAIREVRRVEHERRMAVFAVGTNKKAVRKLQPFVVRSAEELANFDFKRLFRWLSRQIIEVSRSMPGDEPDLPDMSLADWRNP